MDLLLAHAYRLREDPVEAKVMRPYPPLGLLYISAYLKRQGIDVAVYDATFAEASAFAPYLQAHRPRVVGIYVTMVTRRNALQMVKEARAIGARVIVGGPEPAHHADRFLESGVDVVVVGEGEEALAELLPLLAEGRTDLHAVRGIVFRDASGAVVHTEARPRIQDINTLPWPDRGAIDLHQYLQTWKTHHGRSSISLITARGCPFTCSWCSHAVYGHTHRRRKPEDVVAEIKHLVETYQPDQLWIADDVFTVSPAWSFRWAELMKAEGLKVPYECISRADRFSPELATCLAETGCRRVWFGSESGNQEVLDEMSRGVTLEEIRQATRWGQSQGIEVGLFVMVGFGDETPAQVEDTIRHLKETRPDDFLITVAYPIRGTKYWETLAERVLEPADWATTNDRFSRFVGRPSDRYMRFAVSRVIHAVAASRDWREGRPARAVTHRVRAELARVGMDLTRGWGAYTEAAPGLTRRSVG